MKKVLVLLILFIWFSYSYGKEITIYIVTGTDINVSCTDIKRIYLKEKMFINGKKIIPVNLPSNHPLRKIFNRYFLKMDEEELSIYWNEKYYEGITPPIVLKSQNAVKIFLKKVKGSIGYLTKDYLDKDLKVLCVIKVKK